MNSSHVPDLQLRPLFALNASAASGLVVVDHQAWVVSDDRAAVEVHDLRDGRRTRIISFGPGGSDTPIRKRDKPDFEALADLGDGRVVALGSGSRPNREAGFLLTGEAARRIDLSALYARLRENIAALNIEGAVRRGPELLLAHRGVGAGSSCVLRLNLETCLSADNGIWPAASLIEILPVFLGELAGVRLAFTDLALDRNGALHYLAAAEHTDDPYLDGHCAGTIIGRLDARMRATALGRLQPGVKAEGLASWQRRDGAHRWLVVTDADDPQLRSTLYELELPPA